MGFFTNLFNAIVDVVDGVAEGAVTLMTTGSISDAIECVADGFEDAINEFREKVESKREEDSAEFESKQEKNQEEINEQSEKNADDFAENIGDEAVDIEDASVNELRRITNELNDMQEKFAVQAEKIEDDIISYVKTAVHETISEFEEINTKKFGGVALNLNISYLKSFENDIESKIKGRIKNAVRRNLSIDNEECKAVFNKEGKKAKKNAMNKFQIKIYRDAVEELWTIINDTISVQNQAIFTQIENRLNAIEINVNESLRQLEEIELTKNLGEEELRKKQTELQSMIDISAWCMTQLSKENLA